MRVLAATSGKGGVGKTTITLNIVRQLSLSGYRTLLVDFDIHNKGATSLFLDKLSDESPSVMSVAGSSEGYDKSVAEELAASIDPVRLDDKGDLLFLPATQPREMIHWQHFVADNDRLVSFFKAFFGALGERLELDAIVIDCYGGIDSLTVAGAGIADDTMIVNEPDVITFAGTLLLYRYLSEVYDERVWTPRIHFVINRVTSRHTFTFLQKEYEKHLSQLAVSRSVLAYIPHDKLVMETFGEFPFITELEPKGLITKKIRLLIHTLWEDLPGFTPRSARSAKRIHAQTRVSLLADPEWIIRTTVTAPVWLILPTIILIALTMGAGGSLDYRMILFAFYVAMFMVVGVLLFVGLFQPWQVSRWLRRSAGYRRRKRRFEGAPWAYRAVLTAAEYFRAALPAGAATLLVLVLALTAIDNELIPSPPRDLRIWPGEISGLKAHGDYEGLALGFEATIAPGTDLTGANLARADLTFTEMVDLRLDSAYLGSADLSYSAFRGTSFRHAVADTAAFGGAYLFGADLENVRLRAASLRYSELSGARLDSARLQRATLSDSRLVGASLEGAWMNNAGASGADFTHANLRGAILTHTDFNGTIFRGADLQGANLTGAYLEGSSLRGANLREAKLDSVQFYTLNLMGADLRGATGLDFYQLTLAADRGAILDEEQTRVLRDREFVRTPQRSGLEVPRLEELEWSSARDTTSADPERRRTARLDLVEVLLLKADARSLGEAARILETLPDPPTGLDYERQLYHEGIVHTLRALHSILLNSRLGSAGSDWCAWLDQYPYSGYSAIDTNWDWYLWPEWYRPEAHTRWQSALLWAVQNAVGVAGDYRGLCEWHAWSEGSESN